jgi:rare lipoprotein A
MRSAIGRAEAAIVLALLTTACASGRPVAPVKSPGSAVPANAAPTVKIGKPYQVYGVWYYPADDRQYDQRGVASWYGPGFHALNTANGERYDQNDVTAAHKTLPMPRYVEIENLDNGRKLTVRINDRGPFVSGRIIDLSRRSAQLLGVDRPGTAEVRVRRVFPDAATMARLAPPPVVIPVAAATILPPVPAATAVAPPIDSPPPPVTTVDLPGASPVPQPVSTQGQYLVQVAALGDAGRIAWLSGYLSAFGTVVTERAPSGLTRVRLGPYYDAARANAVLAQLRVAGYTDARLVSIPPKP